MHTKLPESNLPNKAKSKTPNPLWGSRTRVTREQWHAFVDGLEKRAVFRAELNRSLESRACRKWESALVASLTPPVYHLSYLPEMHMGRNDATGVSLIHFHRC